MDKTTQDLQDKKIRRCPNCSKTYTSRSGLWKHRLSCQVTHEPPVVTSDTVVDPNTVILSRLDHLENEVNALRQDPPPPATTSDSNNTITNTDNTTNNTITNSNNTTNTANNHITNNIHINYLNTNCKNAMSITEFVDSLVFTKEDIMMFLEDHYDVVVAKLIAKRLINLPVERRPFHCIPPTADASGYFAIKNDTWIQESQPKLEDHMYTAEEDEEYFSMTTPGKLDDIRNKIYDAYEENRKTEPKLEPIRGRMTSGGATAGKVMILGHLMKTQLLKVPTR